MSKINWTQKLTSRRFWMAIAAFVVGVLTLSGADANVGQQVSGVFLSLGAAVAYITGEGYVDGQAAGEDKTEQMGKPHTQYMNDAEENGSQKKAFNHRKICGWRLLSYYNFV